MTYTKKRISLILTALILLTPLISSHIVMAEENTKTFYFDITKYDEFANVELQASNPDNPDDTISIGKGKTEGIPDGWIITGKIVMKPTRIITGTGSSDITVEDFDISSSGSGKNIVLTYILKPYKLEKNISIHGVQTMYPNSVDFYLNGGQWQDDDMVKDGCAQAGCYYRSYITPLNEVNKPKDPKREGYTFLGWAGVSDLDENVNKNNSKKKFTPKNPYQFDEKDPNKVVGYARGNNVKLGAVWVKEPELEVQNIQIDIGGTYTAENLIVKKNVFSVDDPAIMNFFRCHGIKNDFENNETIKYEGSVDTSKEGTYPVTITLTDGAGGKVTKTANVIVKKTPDPSETPSDNETPSDSETPSDKETPSANETPSTTDPTQPTTPGTPVKPLPSKRDTGTVISDLSPVQPTGSESDQQYILKLDPSALAARPTEGQKSEVTTSPSLPEQDTRPAMLPATGSASLYSSLVLGLGLCTLGLLLKKRS